jgi:hypothetical protein
VIPRTLACSPDPSARRHSAWKAGTVATSYRRPPSPASPLQSPRNDRKLRVAAQRDHRTFLGVRQKLSADLELIGEVLNVMRDLARDGMTMLIVTHEMQFAEDVADRVVFMGHGRIVDLQSRYHSS